MPGENLSKCYDWYNHIYCFCFIDLNFFLQFLCFHILVEVSVSIEALYNTLCSSFLFQLQMRNNDPCRIINAPIGPSSMKHLVFDVEVLFKTT